MLIRVLVVDDHPVIRAALKMWLNLDPNVVIVGQAADAATAIELAREIQPDVVIMDVELPDMDGILATEVLRAEQISVAVVVLSLHDDAITEARAKEAGAVAVVSKYVSADELLSAIHEAGDACCAS